MRHTTRFLFTVLVAGAAVTAAKPAAARDPMAAEAAFSEGRKLMKEGRFEEACPKLETSYRLDPALGSLLNLAECLARAGRTASGWLRYREAAALALRVGQKEREAIARERAAALEPRLCRLVVRAPDNVDELQRDGIALPREDRGEPVPADPGVHVIEAKAPGFAPFVARIEVARESKTDAPCKPVVVDVPAELGGRVESPPLAPTPEPTPPPPVRSPISPTSPTSPKPISNHASHWTAQHTLSIVAAGAGVLALGVGTGFAFNASSKNDDANAYCRPEGCTREGRDLHDEAGRSADVATVAIVAGAALLVGGVISWITAPSLRPSTSTVGARGLVVRF